MTHPRHGHGGPYRSRKGLLLGVCKGIAQHFDLSVFWTRVIVFLTFWFTGLFPVAVLYIAAALMMKREPIYPTGYDPEWNERVYSSRPGPEGDLDERLRRMEGRNR
jgi:phage shock protein C